MGIERAKETSTGRHYMEYLEGRGSTIGRGIELSPSGMGTAGTDPRSGNIYVNRNRMKNILRKYGKNMMISFYAATLTHEAFHVTRVDRMGGDVRVGGYYKESMDEECAAYFVGLRVWQDLMPDISPPGKPFSDMGDFSAAYNTAGVYGKSGAYEYIVNAYSYPGAPGLTPQLHTPLLHFYVPKHYPVY